MGNKKLMSQSKSDIMFDIVNYTFLSIILLIVLYPLVLILSSSFSSALAVTAGRVWLFPVEPSLEGYIAVFKNKQVLLGYANSGFYAIVGTTINVSLTLMAAYPLSRSDLGGKGFFMFLFTFTMLFSGGMIPSYLLVKNLGLIDSRWALLIPNAMAIWNMIITRTYFKTTIPNELYESAEIDGSGNIKTFIRIILPLSGPIIAINALFYAIGHWNSYFDALLYLKRSSLFPLQIILRNILILNNSDALMLTDVEEASKRQAMAELLKYSLIIVASAPVLCIYPFVQKYFVKGIMVGSVKG